VHGPTSPVLGERSRFGVAPTVGDLRLVTLVADYRKYEMPVRPFTIATRVQHVGRYGPDASDPRLLPLVWLVQDVVRGYEGHALPTGDCGALSGRCNLIDSTTTNRLFAASVELRFPVVGVFSRTLSYGPLPLEAVVFADVGTFWTRSAVGVEDTVLVRSVGTGFRVNAAGFAFEFDLSHPMDDPQRGFRFGVSFRPGF